MSTQAKTSTSTIRIRGIIHANFYDFIFTNDEHREN